MIYLEIIMIFKGEIEMKCWIEEDKDAYNYFEWIYEDKDSKSRDISVFSINATEIFNADEKKVFMEVCTKKIKKIFKNDNLLSEYKLYLFANIEVDNTNSKVEKYKKVWKKIQLKWDVEEFNKGVEVELKIREKYFFSSIAEFNMKDTSTALEIISTIPKTCTIIASKRENILSDSSITNIFRSAFNEGNEYEDEIDYFYISQNLCPQGDIVFRWGDSSEEAEVAIIFKSEMLESWLKY